MTNIRETRAMCRIHRFFVVILAAGALAQYSIASAVPLTFRFAGTFSSASNLELITDTPFVAGSSIQGSYTVEIDDSGGTSIVFGDGTQGRRLPAGQGNITSSYRTGNGAAGNVDISDPCLLSLDCSPKFIYQLTLSSKDDDGISQMFFLELIEDGIPGIGELGVGDVTQYAVHRFVWTFTNAEQQSAVLEGVITRLNPIPEPTTLALIVTGLILLLNWNSFAFVRWRR
jgi:hypothetical protein